MTLPYSNLQKMSLPPYYLLFKVLIDNKEYLGRMDTIGYVQNFNKPSRGTFNVYKSIEDFKNDNLDKKIETASDKVIILDVIDTISKQHPSPLNTLIDLCKKFDAIPNDFDVDTLSDIIEQIIYSFEDFATEHPKVNKGITSDLLRLKKESQDMIDENRKKTFIIDAKERVNYQIDNLIRFS